MRLAKGDFHQTIIDVAKPALEIRFYWFSFRARSFIVSIDGYRRLHFL